MGQEASAGHELEGRLMQEAEHDEFAILRRDHPEFVKLLRRAVWRDGRVVYLTEVKD